MSSSHSDSEVTYVSMHGGNASNGNGSAKVQRTYYVIPKEPRRRKTCLGSFFCIFLLGLALLLILLPKSPIVALKKLSFSADGDAVGEFQFQNNNYYNVKWKNPDMYLYWVPYNGQTVGAVCYGDDDGPCNSGKYYSGTCAIKLGEFASDESFSTKARTSKDRTLDMLSSSQQEQACSVWMVLNPYEGLHQRLVTSGHVHAEGSIANFGKVHVGNQYYYL